MLELETQKARTEIIQCLNFQLQKLNGLLLEKGIPEDRLLVYYKTWGRCISMVDIISWLEFKLVLKKNGHKS